MADVINLKDKDGKEVLPLTSYEAVYNEDGSKNVKQLLEEVKNVSLTMVIEAQNGLAFKAGKNVLSVRLVKDSVDVTGDYLDPEFKWKRIESGWSKEGIQGKTLEITSADLSDNIGHFTCELVHQVSKERFEYAYASILIDNLHRSTFLLTGSIESSMIGRTVKYNYSTSRFTPDWSESPLVLTPHVFLEDTEITDKCISKKWWKKSTGDTSFTKIISGEDNYTINSDSSLSVSEGKITGNITNIEYRFTCNYYDSVSQSIIPFESAIDFYRSDDGESSVFSQLLLEGVNEFRNSKPASTSLKAVLHRGSFEAENVSYKWEVKKTDGDWSPLTNESNSLEVKESDVEDLSLYRCSIIDLDENSRTYRQVFITPVITIVHTKDPIESYIESSDGGFTFYGDNVNKRLIMRIFRAGEELDPDGKLYKYSWNKYSSSGEFIEKVTEGKSIEIKNIEGDSPYMYECEVEY